ncbi:MAG: phosphoribosyl-AMP cyclohydrolase / phosphoribosyl-ATP pyrophosphohydrolase [Blastocatellia bacterium]|jgi:phosphoribosyl-ATP pyrophosphohydrolase/phosphoribosyl-AMP cyclohydrolase|nr:phosphoribosyl-AMP cyclohydrolase / phosphoribosyl-ATP pyrophosphohydrolase [Blastocatellia bacterium]
MKIAIADIKFDERGLVPAIVQDARTLQVLTLAYMSRESLERTLADRETWFWSRSRASLWHKGETSGNKQRVVEVTLDCDYDALRILVVPAGPACHTGAQTCFHNELLEAPKEKQVEVESSKADLGEILGGLYALIDARKRERPEGSYTTYLFDRGLDKILKKVGEECAETIIAAKNDDQDALVKESSDLLYHLLVMFVERGLTLDQVRDELVSRGREGSK